MKEIRSKYLTIYNGGAFNLTFNEAGYHDPRPLLAIDLYFIAFHIFFPFNSKWEDGCDPPKWGIAIHNRCFWIYYGGKGDRGGGNRMKAWGVPFLEMEFQRKSVLLKDGTWGHEMKGGCKYFWKDEWKEKVQCWETVHIDHDGEVIPVKLYLEEREWRPKWLEWTGLFKKVRTTVDIEFAKEVGKRKGGWKGGVVGTSVGLTKGKTPLECFNERAGQGW